MCWLLLPHDELRFMPHKMYLLIFLDDLVLDIECDFIHHKVELVRHGLVYNRFLFYPRNQFSHIIILVTQKSLIFQKFKAMLDGHGNMFRDVY